MTHQDYLEYKEFIKENFDRFMAKKNDLWYAYGRTYYQYEDELERGSFTEQAVCRILLTSYLVEKTDEMFLGTYTHALQVAKDVLNEPARLDLEEEDKEDLLKLTEKLLLALEKIKTHTDPHRA